MIEEKSKNPFILQHDISFIDVIENNLFLHNVRKRHSCAIFILNRTLQHLSYFITDISRQNVAFKKYAKQNEETKNNNTLSCTSKECTKEPEDKNCNSFQNKSSRKFLSTTFIYNFSFRVSICLKLRFFKFFCILLTVSIYFYFSVAFSNYGGNRFRTP